METIRKHRSRTWLGLTTVLVALISAAVVATPGTATATQSGGVVAAAVPRAALAQWWNGTRQDNFLSGTAAGNTSALDTGYHIVGAEGFGVGTQLAGTMPLFTYWHGSRRDNLAVASAAGIADAQAAGYTRIRVEAYIYRSRVSGTVPLYLYWNSSRTDNMTVSSAQSIAAAEAVGYRRVRVEGYVYPTCCPPPV